MNMQVNSDFVDNAPLSELQRLRSYSRLKKDGNKETWNETNDRVLYSPNLGLKILGKFTDEETELIKYMLVNRIAHGSARWYWVGGTEWIEKPENYSGAFNCSSFAVRDWHSFGFLMNLGMQGCGTGANVELEFIDQLPIIRNKITLQLIGRPGLRAKDKRVDETTWEHNYIDNAVYMVVGDSREGWYTAYQKVLELSSDNSFFQPHPIDLTIDLSNVRPAGERLKGFGGVANPIKLPDLFEKMVQILNKANGRKLNSLEVCLLLNEAGLAVVAGNIRRVASIQQGSAIDETFTTAKDDLWQQDPEGNWKIDSYRDSLRMANLTRVFHHKPTLEEVTASVTKQFYSGEGALQYAAEAIARCNRDLLNTDDKRRYFLSRYNLDKGLAFDYLESLAGRRFEKFEAFHRFHRYQGNPCFEVMGFDFMCNLGSVHLNMLDPFDFEMQEKAFQASALQTAAFLQRGFTDERQQQSRDLDPIVLVSFTGAFTFFTKAFGADWLKWWQSGRPEIWGEDTVWFRLGTTFSQSSAEIMRQGEYFRVREQEYLLLWKNIVHETVWEYCDRHGLKRPNRCTGIKPEGSLTLLTGVGCNGNHAPKNWYYIRRMTFAKDDPIALAAMDYGYTVVPSQSDKDEKGKLLNDPFDPRCTEWLVEVPVEEEIVRLYPDAQEVNPSKFSALAQFDWFMQVQKYYSTHNVSQTIEFTQDEIEPLSERIYEAIQNDEGYISTALLARFEANETFPRLPFEPISKDKYLELKQQVLERRKSEDFDELFKARFLGNESMSADPQDSACGDGFCSISKAKFEEMDAKIN